jgi:prephenate dehydrogenase
MKFKKIVIIGTGLIGGSIGKALIRNNLAEEVIGVCRRESSLLRAYKEKAITKGYVDEYVDALNGAEIVFIATPVHTIKKTLDKLGKIINDKRVIVTDVGSTKKEICRYAAKFAGRFTFIGGHPMAGSEKTGVENSTPDLFKGSVCLLAENKKIEQELFLKLKSLWEALGANVLPITPEKHDRNLAYSSHLPHVIAYALAGTAEKEFPDIMAAAGFKDTTRIASSDAVIWTDIFMSNREYVLEAIKKYKKVLSKIEKSIRNKNEEELQKHLRDFKKVRDELFKTN